MNSVSRRSWLRWAALATISASGVSVSDVVADSPTSQPRISTARLPVTSRSIRLKTARETRAVITSIAADPRGELLAVAGDDYEIRILQASTLKTIHLLKAHRDIIRTLAFDDHGDRLVSAGNDGKLVVWNREKSFEIEKEWNGTPALARVCFHPRGNEIAAVGFDSRVYVIGRRQREVEKFRCHCTDLRALGYRADQEILAVAGRSGNLHLFAAETGDLLSDHPIHRGRIHDLAFQPESNLVVCVGEDGAATVFDTAREELIHRVSVTTSKLFAIAVLNSQLVAVAGSDNVIRVINIDRGEVVRTLKGHHGSVSTLDSSGGWLFSGSFDATLRRWAVSDIAESTQRIAEGDPRLDR